MILRLIKYLKSILKNQLINNNIAEYMVEIID